MNGNIITRRLCRNKQMDDNELYRSNSFKFEKFKRDEVLSNCNTLPRPVSVLLYITRKSRTQYVQCFNPLPT